MIIILLLFYVKCGHIYSGGVTITNPIATKAHTFALTFALESGLDADEYIKVQFPFPLHSTSIVANLQTFTSSAAADSGDWDLSQLGEGGQSNVADLGTTNSLYNIDNTYYLSFNQTIRGKAWHILTLYANNLNVQTSGYKYPIKMWSVASLSDNSIIYDENPSFAQIALGSLPSNSLKLEASYTTTTLGQAQEITLTITPTVTIGQKTNLLIEIDSSYTFIFIDETTECMISSGCACAIASTTTMSITCSVDLATLGQSTTLTANIKNSNVLYTAAQSTSISVYSIVGSTYLEYKTLTGQLKLGKLTLSVNLLLLWGIPADTDLVTLYKPAAASKGYPFNSVTVQFTLNSPTPQTEQLITITTGDADAVLQSSIAHNLGSGVVCYFRKSVTMIYCKHVQSLQADTTYSVSFKCAFTSSAATLQLNFGRVTIKSVVRTTTPYTTYILAGPTGQNVKVQQSEEFTDAASQGLTNWGYNYISAGDTSSTFSTAYSLGSGRTAGLKLGSQRLIFYLQVSQSQMCPASFSYCGTGQQPELFMKVLFNKNNIKYDNTTITIEQGTTCTQCTTNLNHYNTNDVYLVMKCSKNYNVCSQLFNGGKGFGFVGDIQSNPSLYPSNQLLDFVVAFYQAPTGSSENMATLVSVQLIHGYIIGQQTRTLKASYINYLTSGVGAGSTSGQNKGLLVPTFLRVLGQVTSPATHVGIFIDGSVQKFLVDSYQQNEENDDTGSSTTSQKLCSINNCIYFGHSGTGTTQTYSDIYTHQRMLLLNNFTGSATFDMIAGVLNYGVKPESIVVASLSINNITSGFDVLYAERIFGAAWQISNMASSNTYYKSFGLVFPNSPWDNNADWNSLMASNNVAANYKVADVTIIKPGSTISLTITTSHTDTGNLVSQNSGSQWGAGFLMSGATSFTPTTWSGGSCIKAASILFCPYDQSAYNEASGTLVGSFIVPTSWGSGTVMSAFKYSFSSSSGNMVAFKNEVQSTTGFVVTCTVSDWLPLYPNTKAQEQIVTFNLALDYTLSLGDIFYLQMSLSALPNGLTIDSLCNYQNRTDNLTCAVIGSGTTIKFKSTVTGVSDEGSYIMTDSLILIFYVSHAGLDTDDQTFTASLLNNLNIIEQCSTDGSLTFANDPLPSLLTVTNFALENQYQNTKSYMQIQFQINGRANLQFQSRMQLQLGFMSSTNQILMSSSNSRCLFYEEGGALNRHWAYIYYDASNQQLIFELKKIYYSSVQIYVLKCTNIKNPDTSNIENMNFIWAYYSSLDTTKYTIIQTASIPAPSLELQNVNNPTLTKLLNTPGVPAYYIFQYTPTKTNMTSNGRIFIEFSSGQAVFSQQLFCNINDVEVDCSINKRRITLIPQLQQYTRMVPGKLYNITIGPITQPKSIDGFGKIWLAASLDGKTFSEYGYVVDLPVQSSLPTLLPFLSVSFTQLVARVSKVYLRVNFTAPIRSINTDKSIVLQLGEEFRVPQKRSGIKLECRLYRVGDITKTNFTSSCEFVKGELITVQMLYDSSNSRSQQSYQLEIRSLTTPDWVSLNGLSDHFPSQVQVYITDSQLQSVTYIGPPCFQYLSQNLIFTGQSNQEQFQWYIYNRAEGTYSKLIPIVGMTQYPTYTVYKGLVEQDMMLFLGLDTSSTQFKRQVKLSITQSIIDIYGTNQVILDMYSYNSDGVSPSQLIDPNTEEDTTKAKYQMSALLSQTMTIEIGDYGYYFHLAAKPKIGSGIYYLEFDRVITDQRVTASTTVGATTYTTVDFYSKIPTLAIRVDTNHQCPISVSVTTAKIPLLGKSQPIYLETTCIPIEPLFIQPVVQSPVTTPQPVIMGMPIITQFASSNPRSKLNYYFILETSSEGSAGSVVNVTFTISGEAKAYFTIDLLQLSIVKNAATVVPYVNATLDANSTSISTNCSKDATLIWSLSPKGLPSYTFTYGRRYYTNSFTLAANLYDFRLFNFLNPLNQYLQFYQQYTGSVVPSDINALYSRQVLFGIIGEERINYMVGVSANSNKVIKVNTVEPHMQMQVSCLDQYDQMSEIVTLDLSSSTNIKLRNHTLFTLQFQRAISTAQINNLICSIKELLLLNFHHVTGIACQICNPNLLSYSKKSWSDILSLTETYEQILNKTLTSATTNTQYYFYLNNYDRDVIKVVSTFLNKITTTNDTSNKIQELAKQITNTTTDPEISYLLRYLTITNYTEGNHDSAQSQVTLTANITSSSINVNITNPNKVIVFIGIQKFTSQLDFSAPLNLRRGLTGNGIQLEQYVLLQGGEESYTFTVQPYNTTNYKYFLQWSSVPIQANCLSQQYQDTQLLVLEYTAPAQSYSKLLFIFTLAIMNY